MTHRARRPALAAMVGLAVWLAGCATTPPSAAPDRSTPSSTGTDGGIVTASAVPSAEPTAPTSVAPSPTGGAPAVPVDPTLLDLLPAQVDGVEIRPDMETAAEVGADPSLTRDVGAIAMGVAVGPMASGDPGPDYAIATLVRLRDGVYSEAFFRDWRDTFEAGVCQQAGGVDAGRSEMTIADRTVYRATCTGGVVMYEVYLADRGVIVSIQGAGPRDYGRQIVAGLKE